MGINSIGGFIAILRKAKGMTQQDLATKLNVSNKTVSKWECDETCPDISLIPLLAEILEVTCDELLKGGRILHEDNKEKTDKKITKQLRHLIGKSLTRFKQLSLMNIMFLMIGALTNFILSYSAYRPDIGFGVMMGIFIVSVSLEIMFLLNLSSKYNDREWLDSSGIDFENALNLVKCKYSFQVFYWAVFLFFLTLPLVFTRIFAQGDWLPVKSVLMFDEYIKLLPYFLIIPIVGLSPAQSLYKTIFIKECAQKINKKVITFDFIQLALIAFSFGIGYYNLLYITESFTMNVLPFSLLAALMIIGGTIFLLCVQKNIEKNERVNILATSVKNLIYLFCPLIETLYLTYMVEGLAVFLNYSLIIVATTVYALIIRKAK